MTGGMIIGDISSARVVEAQGRFFLANAKAASVPSTVARAVALTPTIKLVAKAFIQGPSLKIFSYHFTEKPGIGYERKLPLLKDIGTTANSGRIIKTHMQTPKALKKIRLSRESVK